MSKEQDPESIDPIEVTNAFESDEVGTYSSEPNVDQEVADEYGFTPQQAKVMSLYL